MKIKHNYNPTETIEIKFTKEKLDNFRTNFGGLANQMRQVINFLRSTAERKSVPAYCREHVSEQFKLMEELYHVKT